ncbi:transglycosylase SLT domain-containing protein [Roseateles sp. BYS180W]|uniref:Transglycosylase SLT domain-containing protein n=1 Tax=Roseateles rivi TaxID=3299028 RepID=A0ABW7FVM7_9BURK
MPDKTTAEHHDGPATTAENSAPAAPQLAEAQRQTPTLDGLKLSTLLADELDPEARIDLNSPAAQSDLWERIRAGMKMPEHDNDLVRKAEAWYAARPDYVERMTERSSRYLFHIVEEIERRGMPMELALLPFIESAFRTDAQSSAKAVGMWQFMPATGRDFDLVQNIFRDDRRDVLASTRAALDYLQRLNKMFDGDWQLALAAYNWGQGNVARAVARNQKAGLPTNYDSLRMPDETRYYLPKLQAVKNIVLNPQAYKLSLPRIENHPYFLSVNIDRDIDVALAARLAQMDEDQFKLFNPQMNKPVILAASSGQILLPYNNASAFVENLARHRGPTASWTAWQAPRTLSPADAAKQVGMSEQTLRDVNRIPPRMLIKQGSTLLVARHGANDRDVSEHMADNASMALAPVTPPLRRVTVKARSGDTVARLAKRYRLDDDQVAQWNKMGKRASLKSGQTVVLYLPGKTAQRTLAKAGKGGKAVASARQAKSSKNAPRSRNARVATAPSRTAVR